ncbi:GPI-anchored surface protein, putative [Bodo saltans]|uniref:GPI-anchored surface protein, putative n=1 Tax=Bodo saltans TaxID=75058 RepID=A0A0S4IWR3_BODSA|nr:GPI-anchored surface protein, putative [Bodo saltans]|eukprot:CUG06403.1 GPI-anchored surface protein, putative [Bodo saltans]
MVTLAGLLGQIIAATTDLNITSDTAQLMLYAGIADLVTMAVIFLVYQRCIKDDDSEVKQRSKVMDEETKSISIFSTLQSFVIFVACCAFGVLCWGIGTTALQDQLDNVGENFAHGLSGVAGLFALVFLVWFVMCLSQAGRRKQWALHSWFESKFLRVFLLTISLAYIPIGAGVFLMFNCNSFSCPNGYRLPDDGSFIYANDTTLSSNDYCVSCTPASGQLCPVVLQNSMCVGSNGNRLEYSISTECSNVRTFFWPAAGIIIVMFILGVPAMFYSLIEISSSTLKEKFPIKEIKVPDNDPDFDLERATWHKQVIQSQNVAKFLFSPFQYQFRYVRLFLILQKLLIVSTTSYVIRNTSTSPQMIALLCSVIIHFISFMLLLYYTPFVAKFEARIAVLMSICLSGACVISILLLQGVDIPSVVMYIVIGINGLLPLLAVGFGLYLEWSSGKADDERKEKEEMNRLTQEIEKKLEDEKKREEEMMAASVSMNPALQVTSTTATTDASPHTKTNGHNFLPSVRETVEERRRKQLKRLRLNQEAKAKVRNDLEMETLKLNDDQGDVDLFIDRSVKTRLQLFLMIAGVLGAVALSLCVIGVITRETSTVLGPFPSPANTETELAGYSSWNDFRYNCCCTQNTNPTKGGENRLIEKWICMNGRIKERVREQLINNVTTDGFGVRGYCSVDFASGCSVVVSSDLTVAPLCNGSFTFSQLKLW